MAQVSYDCSGLLAPSVHLTSWQRSDQGRDMTIPWRGVWQAPGDGFCVEVTSDRPFPYGFGPRVAVVRFTTGRFADSRQEYGFYFGHCTSLVSAGEHFSFGHPLARADQGFNFEGSNGGWTEFGVVQFSGAFGPNSSSHWFDGLLRTPLVVNVPDPFVRYGDSGPKVWGISHMLQQMGYLQRPYGRYGPEMHAAVVTFKLKHRIPMPPPDSAVHRDERGRVTPSVDVAMQHQRDLCLRSGRPDWP